MSLKDDLLERIDLRALAEEAGAKFNSNDSSACPLHKGTKPNFHLYRSDDGRTLRYHCFSECDESVNDGNAIDFWMRWKNVEFKTAFDELVRRAGLDPKAPRPQSAPKPAAAPSPLKNETPGPTTRWMNRAEQFIGYAQKTLWSDNGNAARKWLMDTRGLSAESIRRAELGLNPRDLFDTPVSWGLTDKKVYCSKGIVIPHRIDGKVQYVNVRRPLKGEALAEVLGGPTEIAQGEKYMGPRGGKRGLYGIERLSGKPIVLLVEGEFDSWIGWQAANDFADVVTIGGARMRLDVRGAVALLPAVRILAIYDDDAAADKGRDYLKQITDRVMAIKPPDHDLTDYWKHGGDLRAWLADRVAQQMTRLIASLDAEAQPQTFTRWLEIERVARAACTPDLSGLDEDQLQAVQETIEAGRRVISVKNGHIVCA